MTDKNTSTTQLAKAPATSLTSVKVASLIRRGMDDLLRRVEVERLLQEGWSLWDREGTWYDEVSDDQTFYDLEDEEEFELLKLEAFKAGLECFERAIAFNPDHSGVQSALGEAYYFGLGVHRNFRDAFEWWEKAASQGDATAQCSLGWMYLHGLGVPRDSNRAAEWYRKAASQGCKSGRRTNYE